MNDLEGVFGMEWRKQSIKKKKFLF